jgi:uncharacterized protein YndB with AHSA1/START domain
MTDKIERELELSAPLEDAWEAVTDPRCLELWLADEVALDLWPGGDASFRTGETLRRGWVEEVSPPDPGSDGQGRLVFWWADGDEPASRVELELAPSECGGSILHVIEARPLEVLDLVGMPLQRGGGSAHGPALIAG